MNNPEHDPSDILASEILLIAGLDKEVLARVLVEVYESKSDSNDNLLNSSNNNDPDNTSRVQAKGDQLPASCILIDRHTCKVRFKVATPKLLAALGLVLLLTIGQLNPQLIEILWLILF